MSELSPLLMVMDGHNLVTRSYFAHRFRLTDGSWDTLKTSDGRESGALYGSIRTFIAYVKQFKPTHVLWTFDYGQSSYRRELRPEYKANRAPKEYDLGPQFNAFDYFLSLVDTRSYREKNVEADDLMAAAACRWSKELPVVIISADHDIRQLVNSKVTVVKPSMGQSRSSAEVIFNLSKVTDYYGMPPSQLPEMWALTGDEGDGIHGVKGVGPKTAKKLLAKYGDLAGVIENDLKMQPFAKQIAENWQLIELDGRHAKLSVELDECKFDLDYLESDLRDFLEDWEMKSLLAQLDEGKFWE